MTRLSFIVLSLLQTHHSSASIPQSELTALAGIYDALGGDSWVINLGWSSLQDEIPTDPCDRPGWHGVACQDGHIISLRLDQNNLRGQLPSFENLTRLIEFDAIRNSITGTLPYSLGAMTDLSILRLSLNFLTGTIPSSLGDLTSLQYFQLSINSLEGALPNELCALSELLYLDIDENALTGKIPSCLCDLSSLQMLLLYENLLTGSIPSCLGDMDSLKKIVVHSNALVGVIPIGLCALTNLEALILGNNLLIGTIPPCLADLSSLQEFTLNNNTLSGTIPNELCKLSELGYLWLEMNALTGTIPSCLGDLVLLEWFALYSNNLVGSLPSKLCALSKLKYIELSDNSLTGKIPSCLGYLTSLQYLTLYNNALVGAIPMEICALKKLESVDIHNNLLSSSIPFCVTTELHNLRVLSLQDNELGGTLPSEWNLPFFESLVLSNNPGLTGRLPVSLFQHVGSNSNENIALLAIIIEGTGLDGPIPETICDARMLNTLALSGNMLTGPLPVCLTKMNNLTTLRAASNLLTGDLPHDISKMTLLKELDLSFNLITGRVPAALGDISVQLTYASLEFNHLSCDLPDSVRRWTSNHDSQLLLLSGNYFGCHSASIFALSIQEADGMKHANKKSFHSYSCGSSNYAVPLAICAFLGPFGVAIIIISFRERIDFDAERDGQIFTASRTLFDLTISVLVAMVLACGFTFVSLNYFARNTYECEYAAGPTLALKKARESGDYFSFCVGCAVSSGIAFFILRWRMRHHPFSNATVEPSLTTAAEDDVTESSSPDESPRASSQHRLRFVDTIKAVTVFCVTGILIAAPNIGYILVSLSTLPHKTKIVAGIGIAIIKTVSMLIIFPSAVRFAARKLLPGFSNIERLFELKVALSSTINVLAGLVVPIITVTLTDNRCLYYRLFPQDDVSTATEYEYCDTVSSTTGRCLGYGIRRFNSIYRPKFSYSGDRCFAAVVSTYAPVFLLSVLFSAIIPAVLEVLLIPQAVRSSQKGVLKLLRQTTFAVSLELDHMTGSNNLGPNALRELAQRVVYRGIVGLLSTLVLALTFGIAAPVVGIACVIAALVQLAHHDYILRRIVECASRKEGPFAPNLMGCCVLPRFCVVLVVGSVALTWFVGIIGYLPLRAFCVGGLAGTALIAVATFGIDSAQRILKQRQKSNDMPDYEVLQDDGALRWGSVSSVNSSGIALD